MIDSITDAVVVVTVIFLVIMRKKPRAGLMMGLRRQIVRSWRDLFYIVGAVTSSAL